MIIFDWNGTLALNNELVEGAAQLLELLNGVPIVVVSRCKGDQDERRRIIEAAVPGAEIFITDGEKKPEMKKALNFGTSAIVIGDRIKKEIRDGNDLGLFTVWVAGGRFPHEPPTTKAEMPDVIVWHLKDLLKWPWHGALQDWPDDVQVVNDIARQPKCRCGCGCDKPDGPGESGLCRRCQVGDCPHPDEELPARCPQCGRKSNVARIEEFGWCLRADCKRPQDYRPWSMTWEEWEEWMEERDLDEGVG